MNTLTDVMEISLRCLRESAAGNRSVLVGIAACGLLFGVFSWMLCGATMRLWNRSFHLRLGHHVVCGVAGILTVLLAALLLGCGSFQAAAQSVIRTWRERLAHDVAWRNAIFVDLYEQVRKSKREDFSRVRSPADGGRTVPDRHPETQRLIASAWGVETAARFSEDHPFLALLLPVRRQAAANAAFADYAKFRGEHPSTDIYLFAENAARVAADEVARQLQSKTSRIVLLARILIVAAIVLLQVTAYGVAAWSAYTSLKVTT